MRRYPKFLKVLPSFSGLTPVDFISLGLGLLVSSLLALAPLTGLILMLGLIGVSKLIRQHFDVVGFFLPRQKRIIIPRRQL